MAKRKTTGVTIVLSDTTDPERFEAFKAWYQDVHSPDIVGTGGYHDSNRYENPSGDQAKMFALHETDWAEPTEALEEMRKHIPKWQRDGRLFDGMKVFFNGTFKRIF